MKTTWKTAAVVACLLFASVGFATGAFARTLGYPSTEHASFLIDVPQDWEITPAENEGDYVTVTGPTGVVISLRTIAGSADDLKAAIDESSTFLKENYENVQITPPQASTQKGLKGFLQTGSGKDKQGGHEVGFAMAWYDLKDGKIGEVWYVVTKGDDPGRAAAGEVLGSFRAP